MDVVGIMITGLNYYWWPWRRRLLLGCFTERITVKCFASLSFLCLFFVWRQVDLASRLEKFACWLSSSSFVGNGCSVVPLLGWSTHVEIVGAVNCQFQLAYTTTTTKNVCVCSDRNDTSVVIGTIQLSSCFISIVWIIVVIRNSAADAPRSKYFNYFLVQLKSNKWNLSSRVAAIVFCCISIH